MTGIRIHDNREKNVSHTNPDIDKTKSGDNYTLQASENFNEDVKQKITSLELKRTPRKDAVVMCQALITSDKEFFDQHPAGQWKQFFVDSFKFIKEQYGAENIISATVHLDEKTPHLHVNFVPVTQDGRLSAKDLITRESLRTLQDDFFQAVGAKYGLKRGESREERRKHLNTEEFKAKTKKAEIERLKEHIKPYVELEKGIEKIEARGISVLPGVVAIKKQNFKALQDQAKAFEANKDEISNIRVGKQEIDERERKVSERERNVAIRENTVEKAIQDNNNLKIELKRRQVEINEMYSRQRSINEVLEQTEKELEEVKEQNNILQEQNNQLKIQNEEVFKKLGKKDLESQQRARGLCEAMAGIVQAVGMFKHKDRLTYKIRNITKDQENLIEAVKKRAIDLARSENFHDIATNIETKTGLSQDIKKAGLTIGRGR